MSLAKVFLFWFLFSLQAGERVPSFLVFIALWLGLLEVAVEEALHGTLVAEA